MQFADSSAKILQMVNALFSINPEESVADFIGRSILISYD